jgi:MSHA biogenesis protein MshQ
VTAVVSPAKLIVASPDTNADCASGDATCSAFKAAGAKFNLNITASCNNDTVTKNFEMNNIPLTVTTVAPNVGNPVSLGVTSINVLKADNGIHKEINQTVSEVGVFTITATPPVNGYFGETIPAAVSTNIGRFIPDHFDVDITDNSFEDSCTTSASGFTYIGQPFTYFNAPELLITAKNRSGITTKNYTETGYQRLTAADIVRNFPIEDTSKDGTVVATKMVVSAVTSDGNLTEPTSVPSSNAGEMTYTFDSLDSFTYSKNSNSEVGFFTSTYDIVINSIQDLDGANASTSLAFNVPSTNTVSPTGVNLRFGRWQIENTFGPETSNLPVPMAIEYWNGSDFLTNTLDSCTAFDGGNVDNYSLTLNVLNNPLSAINLTPLSGNGDFSLGLAELKVGKPTDGTRGQVRLTYSATPIWLQYDWGWSGTGTKVFDENPSAIATFGLYRGNDRIIYIREVYN